MGGVTEIWDPVKGYLYYQEEEPHELLAHRTDTRAVHRHIQEGSVGSHTSEGCGRVMVSKGSALPNVPL